MTDRIKTAQTEAGSASTDPVLDDCLRQINTVFEKQQKLYRRAAEKTGVSFNLLNVYYCLMQHEGSLPLTELLNVTALPKQTLNSMLRRLEEEGKIRLEPHPCDRRSKIVVLCEPGWKQAQSSAGWMMAIEKEALASLPVEQIREMLEVEIRIAQKVTEIIDALPERAGKESR